MNSKYKSDAILIGKRIAIARKAADLTQERLANEIGIVTKHLSEIERGISGVSVGTIIEIARKLNVSLDYLLLGEEKGLSPLNSKLKRISPCQKQYLEELIDVFINCCLDEK